MSEYRKISELIPYANNARTHSQNQIAQLAASIDHFGFCGRIVIKNGTITKGHGTVMACNMLIESGKVITHPPDKDSERVPLPAGQLPVIDASGWTDGDFKAYVIADNKLAENAGWDEELLAIELEGLKAEEYDLDLVGFDESEVEGLIKGPQFEPGNEDEQGKLDVIDKKNVCPDCGCEFS